MQPPVAGRTGKAPPPPVGPPGAGGGAGAALDIAFVAVVSGVDALAPAPTTAAPHPTITTNRPALARSATDLPTFLITRTVGAGRLMRTTEARRLAELDAAGNGFAIQGHLLGARRHWQQGAWQRVESCRQIVKPDS
jgi:hypothetical protein